MDGNTCCRCCAFGRCYCVRDILGSLADTGKEDTGSGGTARVQLRVCLKEPAILGTGHTEEFTGPVGILLGLDCCCEHDKVNFHVYRAVEERVIGHDMQVLGLGILEDVSHAAADELGAFILDTVVELLIHLPKGTDIHVEDVGNASWDLLDDLVAMFQ